MPTFNNQTGLLNRNYKDSDMCSEARSERYTEYVGLNNLPFWNKQQSRRLNILNKLRVRDNRFAFERDLKNHERIYEVITHLQQQRISR